MTVRALIPLKSSGEAKSRLAPSLAPAGRAALAVAMATHVAQIAAACVDELFVLGPEALPCLPRLDCPGEGLNADLAHACAALPWRVGDMLLVLPADLPMLIEGDVHALIAAATGGVAIAPDRAGTGTNGLALAVASFRFAFGPGSRAAHEAEAIRLGGAAAAIVMRPGLAFDIDMPDDLREWRARSVG